MKWGTSNANNQMCLPTIFGTTVIGDTFVPLLLMIGSHIYRFIHKKNSWERTSPSNGTINIYASPSLTFIHGIWILSWPRLKTCMEDRALNIFVECIAHISVTLNTQLCIKAIYDKLKKIMNSI